MPTCTETELNGEKPLTAKVRLHDLISERLCLRLRKLPQKTLRNNGLGWGAGQFLKDVTKCLGEPRVRANSGNVLANARVTSLEIRYLEIIPWWPNAADAKAAWRWALPIRIAPVKGESGETRWRNGRAPLHSRGCGCKAHPTSHCGNCSDYELNNLLGSGC